MIKKIFVVFWLILATLLFLYSFTQVDLSLTLSRLSIWQTIQKSFQYIGYFNRPLSSYLYVGLLGLMFILYGWSLYLIKKKRITRKVIWMTIFAVSAILLFSYNAFSYDMFNYMFDARIITHYQQNPYEHKALDFPGDPMLSFMRWTHRVYPYGPVWLLLSVPFSFVAGNFFLLTFYLFKLLAVFSYIGTAFFIEKISRETEGTNSLFTVAFFAFNPLVIIESLVSGHNDIVMMFFMLGAIYYSLRRKLGFSFLMFIASVGIKFATLFLLPLFAFQYFIYKKGRFENVAYAALFIMIFTIIVATKRTNFQPWYLLYALPFAAFVSNKKWILVPSFIISLFALLRYLPFLYLGNWDKPVPAIMFNLTLVSIIISVAYIAWQFAKARLRTS